jgi:hypothetical protein
MGLWEKQPSSKLGRSIVTQIATQFTTPFGSQTRQVRIVSTLALWATIDSTAVVTANSASALIPANVPEYFCATPGQVLSTSTSTGYVSLRRWPRQAARTPVRDCLQIKSREVP